MKDICFSVQTRTKQNPNPNKVVANEFIPKKDKARVGGAHNVGLRPDTIQRPLRPKTCDAATCHGHIG
jgi:hypothetical protein